MTAGAGTAEKFPIFFAYFAAVGVPSQTVNEGDVSSVS
jgi:hypothetical protein